MKTLATVFAVLAGLPSSAVLAAPPAGPAPVDVTPANFKHLKAGLWELSRTQEHTGGDSFAQAARESEGSLTPEQRERLEAVLKKQEARHKAEGNAPKTEAAKVCITQAEFAKPDSVFGRDLSDTEGVVCTREVKSRTDSRVAATLKCTHDGKPVIDVETTYETTSPEQVSVRSRSLAGHDEGKGTNESSITGRWLSADCGAVKPRRR